MSLALDVMRVCQKSPNCAIEPERQKEGSGGGAEMRTPNRRLGTGGGLVLLTVDETLNVDAYLFILMKSCGHHREPPLFAPLNQNVSVKPL